MKKTSVSVIILAGGKSARMYYPKPYLNFDGRTFAAKISDTYKLAGVDKIILVLNAEYSEGKWEHLFEKHLSKFTLVKNKNPELGRFHSLKLGLKEILDDEFCFIQNIDNPFISEEVIDSLWEKRNPVGYSSPVFQGQGGHPVLLSQYVTLQIDKMEDGDFSLKEILNAFPKNEVEMNDDLVLINMNTPEEYLELITKKNGSEKYI